MTDKAFISHGLARRFEKNMNDKLNVILRAPALSASGYGVHSRQIARWLFDRNDVNVIFNSVQWGITPWLLHADAKDGLIGKLLEATRAQQVKPDVSIQVQLPNEWDAKLAKVNIGVTAGVETTLCNPKWIDSINSMDAVIVPSQFVKDTFKASGELKDGGANVHVIPESFFDAVGQPKRETNKFEFSTRFNFLCVAQMTNSSPEYDRKNLLTLIKVFCDTFKSNPDVGLIIKTNSGRESKIDRKYTQDVLLNFIKSVRKDNLPKIHFLHGLIDDDDFADLYKDDTVKAFVTLTRGEGFCLPMLEAAVAGLPVIAPAWSGYMDFMSKGKFIKLDKVLTPVPPQMLDKNIFVENSKWASIDELDVKKKLLKFYERPEIPMEWSKNLSNILLQTHSYLSIRHLYDEIFALALRKSS